MPILNMVSWGCLLKAASNSIISGRGVVDIWNGSSLGGVVGVFVGSVDGVSGMVVGVVGCLGGLLVGMGFLWVIRLGSCQMHEVSSSYRPFPSKFRANDIESEYIRIVAIVFREDWPIGQPNWPIWTGWPIWSVCVVVACGDDISGVVCRGKDSHNRDRFCLV